MSFFRNVTRLIRIVSNLFTCECENDNKVIYIL
jgi:hypothetical protein